MIADVDESLRTLLKREALTGTDVDVLFDAPTRDWGARRNTPTLDMYLYDIREDLKWRSYGTVDVKGPDGHTTGRREPPKYFKLSYLVTAWTQRPEDEHRLLSAVLLCLLKHPALPADVLSGVLSDQAATVRLSVALPPPDERSISEVWTALGGELKPSLDVACLTPIDVEGVTSVAALVVEPPQLRFGNQETRDHGGEDRPKRRRRRDAPGGDETGEPGRAPGGDERAEPGRAPAARGTAIEEQVGVGRAGQPGRRYTFRTITGDVDR